MDLIFLGTGSAYPSPHRAASSLALRHHRTGAQWLVDCGEGTQVQAQKCVHIRPQRISRIFITHLHGDHIFGLPGLLATISGMREHAIDPRTLLALEPSAGPPELEIYGPAGLRRSLLRMAYTVHELHPTPEQTQTCFKHWTPVDLDPVRDPMLVHEREGRDILPDPDGFFRNIFGSHEGTGDGLGDFVVHAFMLDHPVPCVGYLMLEPAPLPRLIIEKATKLGIQPGPLLKNLKNGESVTFEKAGVQMTVRPDQVLGPPLRGRRIAILGDSRDSSELGRLLAAEFPGVPPVIDCMVHEATGHSVLQGDDAMRAKGHSTARGATEFAATLGVRQLVLNHFSQRFLDEETYSRAGKNEDKYSKVCSLLEDAQSVKEFKGTVQLAGDLKVIPIVANVLEDGVKEAKN